MTEKITLENKTLNVHRTDDGDGKTLAVLIHGLTGNYLQMHHFQAAISASYHTMSYDLSGRGDSDLQHSPADIHQHTEDLLQLLDRLDYEKYILVGYSMGGYIALETASKLNTVKKVVLLDGGGEADEDTRNLVVPSLGRLDRTFDSLADYSKMMQSAYGALGVEWSEVMDQVVAHEVRETETGVEHKSDHDLTLQDFESFYRFPHSEVYSKVDVPVLLVICTGPIKDDTSLFNASGYDRMLDEVRNIESNSYAINHYEIVFNRQNAMNEEIKTFLDKE